MEYHVKFESVGSPTTARFNLQQNKLFRGHHIMIPVKQVFYVVGYAQERGSVLLLLHRQFVPQGCSCTDSESFSCERSLLSV